ncbi:MAG TPA: BTAD domain-containing putative transcriptional regulator [Gemmatimonadaceae bacterium]|nr:BTAD domain-containing putative transcriptional regulator [Gemmatimonadaceae bacterium]
MLHLFALGELRLESDAGVVLSRRRKPLVLLVFLARRAPLRPASRVELASLLWGERPEAKARQSLRQALVELHHLVGDRLQVTNESVRLVTDDIALDVARFEEDVEAGRDREAIARWTGDFCAGAEESGETAFRAWADPEAAGLRRRLAVAFERLLDAAARRGDDRDSIAVARLWTSLAPLDEQACLSLVTALRRAGRPVDALAVHTSFVTRLRETLDVAPSRAFLRLASTLDESTRTPPPRPASQRPAADPAPAPVHRFVGRATAFAAISSAWSETRTGMATTMLVRAERGMGATRLFHELVRWARDADASTLTLHASDAPTRDKSYSYAGDVLHALHESPALGGVAPESLAALAVIVPAVRARFAQLPSITDSSPARLARAVRDALETVAEESPVIVVIDRAENREDADSRALLLDAARGLTGAVLVLVVTDPADPERHTIELVLEGARSVLSIALEPLSANDVSELLETDGGLEANDARMLGAALHRETGGVPFHVCAFLDSMLEEDALATVHARTRSLALPDVATLPVPPSIRATVLARRAAASSAARRVLDGVAVFGRPLSTSDAVQLVGLTPVEVAEAVAELVRVRLLVRHDDDRYAISPRVVERAVYELVPALRREALHAIAATLVPRDKLWRPRTGAQELIAHHEDRSTSVRRRRIGTRWRVATGIAVLAVVGGGIARSWRPTAAPSPTATVAIFPFAVSGDQRLAYLQTGMVDVLSTSLDGAGGLRTIDPRAVLAIAQRVPGAPPIALDEAREAARKLGARYFVLGTVLGAGTRLEMSASLYPTNDSAAPVTRASASGLSDGLFDIVDRVTAQLAVAHGATSGERLAQLAAVTTPSLDALKAYLEAQSAYRANDLYAAIPAYQRAVAADSSFALAWYGLASAASWMLQPRLEQEAAAAAVRHSGRLSGRDRVLLAGFAEFSRGSADSAERMATGIAEAYDDIEAWALLGEVLYHHNWKRGRSATESRRAWERVLALDPRYWPALEHLAEVAALEGNAREADSLLARYERSVGADHMMLASRALRAYAYHDEPSRIAIGPQLATDRGFWLILSVWYVSVFGRDIEDAQRLARLLVVPLRPPEQQGFGRVLLAHLALARGHWREARAELAIARAHTPADAIEQQLMLALSPVLASPAAELNAQRAELDALPAAPTIASASSVPWPRPPQSLQPMLRAYLAGMTSARIGDQTGRERALAQLAAAPDPTSSSALKVGLALSIRAEHERAAGHPAAALAALEQGARATPFVAAWTSSMVAQSYERYVRAELLHRLGRDDEALRWYGTFGENSPYDLVYLAPSLLRQAQINDARGERALAVQRYSRFLELWRDCDPELRPMTDSARMRLAVLQQR